MNRKFLCCALIIVCLFNFIGVGSVFAQTSIQNLEVKFTSNVGEVSIKGKVTSSKTETVKIMLLANENENLEELVLTQGDEKILTDYLEGMEEIKTNEKGEFETFITIGKTGISGKMCAFASVDGVDGYEVTSIVYASSEQQNAVLETLKNLSSDKTIAVAELKNIFADDNLKVALQTFGVSMDVFNSFETLSAKTLAYDFFYGLLVDRHSEYVTDGNINKINVSKVFNEVLVLTAINYAESANAIKSSIEDHNNVLLKFDIGEKSQYSKLESNYVTKIFNQIFADIKKNNIKSVKSLGDLLYVNIAVQLINQSRWGSLEQIFIDNSEFLGINTSESSPFASLTKDQQGSVYMKVKENNNYTSADEVAAVFNLAISNAGSVKKPGVTIGGGSIGADTNLTFKPTAPINKPDTDDTFISKFNDISTVEWAKEAITSLEKNKIISGDENGNFNPLAPVKKEEFVKMYNGILKLNSICDDSIFVDVEQGSWMCPYICTAFELQLVTGMGDGVFGVGTEITRQDVAALIYRGALYKGVSLDTKIKSRFNDESLFADYAADAINILYNNNFISGVGEDNFAPNNICTRAESAKILYALMGKIK